MSKASTRQQLERRLRDYRGVLSGEIAIHRYIDEESGELLSETAVLADGHSTLPADEANLTARLSGGIAVYAGVVTLEQAHVEIMICEEQLAALPPSKITKTVDVNSDLL